MNTDIDYGPLSGLIGTWEGDKGMDIAPEPDGQENNPYFETIIFEPVEDDISNAETQTLVALHYRQIVTKKKTGKVFHDETGYWMWDAENQIVMHSLTIPRGVCVLAGGRFRHGFLQDARFLPAWNALGFRGKASSWCGSARSGSGHAGEHVTQRAGYAAGARAKCHAGISEPRRPHPQSDVRWLV